MFTAEINNKKFNIKFSNELLSKGTISDERFEINVIKNNNKSFHIINNLKSYNVDIISIDNIEKRVILKVNQKTFEVKITDELDKLLKEMGIQNKENKKNKDLKAPMPGLVTEIIIKIGDTIQKGDNLLILEAMKMENNLKAEHDAIIKDIIVEKGNSVEKNQVLVTFE
ncbi:MAG: biotin/lipoyl-binding protein [Bacteroidales bacterium]|nr:biotin/lipoyl-binding protein [Bacteroidales bacterium]